MHLDSFVYLLYLFRQTVANLTRPSYLTVFKLDLAISYYFNYSKSAITLRVTRA